MKTFFQTLYFILLIIIISILLPSTITDYLSPNLKLFIAKVIVIITCLFFICLIISNIIKNIITKYNKLYNTLVQIYNHQINTHNKVLDGLSVVKETSKNILFLDKIIKSTERQGKVNQDSLSSVRDNVRNIAKVNVDTLLVLKDDTASHLSMLKIIELGYNTINTNQLELLKLINKLPNNISKDDVEKLTIQLNIILDNQKYLVDNLINSKVKRVSKIKSKESISNKQV